MDRTTYGRDLAASLAPARGDLAAAACLTPRERAAIAHHLQALTGYAAQLRAGEAVGRATSRGPKPQRIFKTETPR